MEIESEQQQLDNSKPKSIQINAPIAEQESLFPNDEIEPTKMEASSSSNHSESVIVPASPEKHPRLGMIRLRRKRKQDPFGNLIQSTKKMKLNDTNVPPTNQGEPQQAGSVECGEEDELVFYYGGEDDDDSADGYDDDEDSNAEHHYENDYPEENLGMGVNELENESTSEDDYFDHYGDEQVKYRSYCYEQQNSSDKDADDDDW